MKQNNPKHCLGGHRGPRKMKELVVGRTGCVIAGAHSFPPQKSSTQSILEESKAPLPLPQAAIPASLRGEFRGELESDITRADPSEEVVEEDMELASADKVVLVPDDQYSDRRDSRPVDAIRVAI
jgi:hypothetical protein